VANGVAETRSHSGSRARTVWVLLSLALIVTADQLTKAWAVSALADGPKHVIGDFLVLDLARNSGSAFSRFRGYTPVLAVVAIVISVFVARAVRQATDRWTLVGLVLVLGGALGNLADRLARSPGFLRGHVVDFVGIGPWPLFNVADSCITVGAILLVVRTLFPPAPADGDGPAAAPDRP
jgi:signal peptidase II